MSLRHTLPSWFLTHHVLSIMSNVLVLLLVTSLLRERRRPLGNVIAWLLAVVLVPYLGIPFYLIFGGRKLKQRARKKRVLDPWGGRSDDLAPVIGSLRRVFWLDDGVLAFHAFLRQIQGAQHSIRIATFVLADDEAGGPLVDAMIERARAGVEVRLLIDDLLRFHAPHRKLAELVAAGGRVERFMPLLHLPFLGHNNLRNHRKIAVFDGTNAIVGGMNLGRDYLGPTPAPERWLDLSLLVAGPAVNELDAVFRADWLFACGEVLSSPAPVEEGEILTKVTPSGPDSPTDPIYDAVLTAIFQAESRVWIATPYFLPDDALAHALEIAVRRGVEVRVLTPARSNHLLSDLASAACLRDLKRCGVSIYQYGRMMHAKTLLVDDTLCVVGSANFDMRSLFVNYEIALFFFDDLEKQKLQRWFERNFAACRLGPPDAGLVRTAIDDVARLLAPLL